MRKHYARVSFSLLVAFALIFSISFAFAQTYGNPTNTTTGSVNTSQGTSTVTPGLPNTGAATSTTGLPATGFGGSAGVVYAALIASGAVLVGGSIYLSRFMRKV